ncbi:MAG: hypothetical protein KY434_08850, partial [Actinobacteria bacterium]|nr:hypothetical protein [Actinomycetota bacterium]
MREAAQAACTQRVHQPSVALSGTGIEGLAGRLVVARAQPALGGEVRRGRERAHVDPDLGHDHLAMRF